MQLAEYMAKRRLSDADVAHAIGRTRETVNRYRSGALRPSIGIIKAIERYTGGKVRFDDWLEAVA